MKCKYCNTEGLAWPENWKKGMRPVNAETGEAHECVKEGDSGFLDTSVSVGIQSTLTKSTVRNMDKNVQNVLVRNLICDICETSLINCGCGNCSYLGAIYCPNCEIHPGGKKA